ncbi:MAG: hypothetical protein HFI92_09695 [Lachnospiraceae bacterium]|nr:hypothetical protein [Lachnospiraceae bacterium]
MPICIPSFASIRQSGTEKEKNPEKGRMPGAAHPAYYEKVYLKVLAVWPLFLIVLLYGKEMKESCS